MLPPLTNNYRKSSYDKWWKSLGFNRVTNVLFYISMPQNPSNYLVATTNNNTSNSSANTLDKTPLPPIRSTRQTVRMVLQHEVENLTGQVRQMARKLNGLSHTLVPFHNNGTVLAISWTTSTGTCENRTSHATRGGVTKPIFSVPLFSQFSEWWKQWLPEWYQVSWAA